MDDWSSPWADDAGGPDVLPSRHALQVESNNNEISTGLGPTFDSKLDWQPDLGEHGWGGFGGDGTAAAFSPVVALESDHSSSDVTAVYDEKLEEPVAGVKSSWQSEPEPFRPSAEPEQINIVHSFEDTNHDAGGYALEQQQEPTIQTTHISEHSSPPKPLKEVEVYDASPRDSTQRRLVEAKVAQMDMKALDSIFGTLGEETLPMPPTDPVSSVEARKAWYRISRSGTLLKHKGDSEHYVRVAWARSRIRQEVTKTVASWNDRGSFDKRSSVAVESRFSAMFGWGPKGDSEPSTPGLQANRAFPSISMPAASHHTPPVTPISSKPRSFSIAAPPAPPKLVAPAPRPSTSTSNASSAAPSSVAPARSVYSQDSTHSRRSSQTSLWSSPVAATAAKTQTSSGEDDDDTWGDFADVAAESTESTKTDWNWAEVTLNVEENAQTVDKLDNHFVPSPTPTPVPEQKTISPFDTQHNMPPTPQSMSGLIPPIPISITTPSPTDHDTIRQDFAKLVRSLPNLDYMLR